MSLGAGFYLRKFDFDFAARTSRGAMRDKKSWFIKLWDESDSSVFGMGECGPLPGLSTEDIPSLERVLTETISRIQSENWQLADFIGPDRIAEIRSGLSDRLGLDFLYANPSVAFALETALLDLANGGQRLIFDNSFYKGTPIPINGLVWMGGLDYMLQQVEVKIRDGFKCIKLKIGGIDFEKEVDILQYIRRKYFRDGIVVRLDANGAFKREDAALKIRQLAKFDIHSLEQPVRTGSPDLPQLCRDSPIPIALDEELIGVHHRQAKQELLERIRPAHIILKPTLHGGFFGCAEWVSLAEEQGIGWWITSALESNIGLNAVSQFAANYQLQVPQGLGTGAIYSNNFPSPLQVKKGFLSYNPNKSWESLENN